ncbi:MAG TPA: flagellar motor stator protein MotA [Polyangiaceae bacterium]|nr:flagellar motor stator protein MotA [Polyangiaceae bacterium]
MSSIIGIVVVLAAVLGGFAMAGGPMPVLIQPNELIVIGGAAIGSVLSSAPGKMRGRLLAAFKKGFKDSIPTKQDYLDLLKLLYELFGIMRREGILALENHVNERDKSPLFAKYPGVAKRHHALDFLVEGLKQLVDGCPASDLAQLFDAELETHHSEQSGPVALIRGTGDALPGLGIVAAVLGIVITMAHLDGGPEEIGHHVGAALVGTFLGILLCYGIIGPIANNVEAQDAAESRYMGCIKEALLAAARGTTPALSIEFGRRAIFSDERPSIAELEKAFAELKKSS